MRPATFLMNSFLMLTASTASALEKYETNKTQLDNLPSFVWKPRLFIMTDILNEPDDSMSLVRLLAYSDHFTLQGLCATTSSSLPNTTYPEAIVETIHAYGQVVDNLNSHVHPNSSFQPADELLTLVSSGPKVYGRQALSETLSTGSRHLIDRLESSTEPLYVSIWGGVNTLAQALQHIEKTRSVSEAAALRSRLRVYSISDQDNTGAWIRAKWPEIWYVINIHGFLEFGTSTWSGINSADNGFANTTKVQRAWLRENIQLGPLGARYPDIIYGMEGDTPSFLWLIQNGLSNPERPDWGGWGGRYSRVTDSTDINLYGYSFDTVYGLPSGNYSSSKATVWRWRDAYQDDFAARMRWTLTGNFKDTAHPPLLKINGSEGVEPLRMQLTYNNSVILDASHTIDSDNPEDNSQLGFEWYVYIEAGLPTSTGYNNGTLLFTIESIPSSEQLVDLLRTNDAGFVLLAASQAVKITSNLPPIPLASGKEWHVILQVTNNKGPHPIRRYRRIVFQT